jgi:hypothetical protein
MRLIGQIINGEIRFVKTIIPFLEREGLVTNFRKNNGEKKNAIFPGVRLITGKTFN